MSIKKIIVIVLVFIALPLYGWNAYQLLRGAMDKNGGSAQSAQAVAQAKRNFDVQLYAMPVQFVEVGKDPFVAYSSEMVKPRQPGSGTTKSTEPAAPPANMPAMSINGIMWNDQNPVAVLALADGSTTIVKKGDVLPNGVTVLAVEQDRVQVQFEKIKVWISK